jgi:nuclear protein localization protein 4 homolog
VLVRVATAQNLDDPAVLDPLLTTESWQTVATFARESDRTFLSAPLRPSSVLYSIISIPLIAAPHRPTQPVPDGPPVRALDEDIPPELFDEIVASTRGVGGDSGGSAGGRVCPHCTFENTHGRSDCDVCGLPL